MNREQQTHPRVSVGEQKYIPEDEGSKLQYVYSPDFGLHQGM